MYISLYYRGYGIFCIAMVQREQRVNDLLKTLQEIRTVLSLLPQILAEKFDLDLEDNGPDDIGLSFEL